MPPDRYATFVSYTHRHADWVKALKDNLERGLAAAGRPEDKVFLDQVDLGSGRSWVGQLQEGLARAEHFVLVATPEALASPRVADEWQSFVASRRDWLAGRCHLALLVDTPLPPFLEQLQRVDFREPDAARYRRALQELLAGLLGWGNHRELPALPANVEVPPPVDPGLPPALRSRIVDWLAPLLDRQLLRRSVAAALGFEPRALDLYSSWPGAASAALVIYTKDEDPRAAAARFLAILEEELAEEVPERIGDLAPLRAEIEALRREEPGRELLAVWLGQVAADHERLVPYFQQQAELDLLDRVFVPLELRVEGTVLAAGDRAKERLDRPLGLAEVLALDPREHSWVTRRWVVRGDPGAGKTTLLRHLAAELARREDRPWVPLFESLPRLMREREWLLDRVARRLERAGHPAQGLSAALERAGQEGRLLLLLDGLNEVPREDRENAERLLRDLSARWPASPLVVTSRSIGYRRPGSEFRELDILPLDQERRRSFLARWFSLRGGPPNDARAEAAMAHLAGEPGLWDLAGNPLYLTLIALLLEQGKPLGSSRTILYDQVFDLLLAGRHQPEVEPMPNPMAVRAVLRHLGAAMTEANRDAEPVAEIEARLYQPQVDPLRAPLELVPRWRGAMRRFLDDLAERTGILGPHDGPDADWRFWHRTFREALAAEELARCYREEGEAALLARARAVVEGGDESRWTEPYALLVGREEVKDPDGLVSVLVRENRALGLRALATAQRLRDTTLAEVLELSESWTQRADVYRRLPEQVGEPQRALLLIDRLRRQTRNGNDLFFLDLAAREVAKRSPGYAGQAAEVRAKLYEHIPPPPEDLFRWIKTRDGRVPLWREVPAGSFWMGSPEGEGYSDERLRHEVTFTGPFRIGAVPVTNYQYAAFDPGHKPFEWESVAPEALAHYPVESVTWYEAISFCRWLSASLPWARGARLPVEEEWEYACRAGTQTLYWRGEREDDLDEVGWYDANSSLRTHRVGEKPANAWGLYDVHGNVWEWTLSPETPNYPRYGLSVDQERITLDDAVALDGKDDERVMRGGSYWHDADWARAAFRRFGTPQIEEQDRGFRVLLPSRSEPLKPG